MGSTIEMNDTLKLRRGAGFPAGAEQGGSYPFTVPGRRLYHLDPVRVFLVEDIEGKWNFVGQAVVTELTIDAVREETRGVFRAAKLYPPEYASQLNLYDAPPGKGFGV